MMAGSLLLRRHIVIFTLLVASVALLLVTFNLSHLVTSLIATARGEADLVAVQTATSIETILLSTPNQEPFQAIRESPIVSEFAAGALTRSHTIRTILVSDTNRVPVFSAPGPVAKIDASLDALEAQPSVFRLKDVVFRRPPVFRYSRQILYRDQALGYVDIDVSLENARQEVFHTLLMNLLLALAAIAAALFIAISSTRLITAPLRAITTSIEQIEQSHSLPPPSSKGDREKSNYIELVADRIEQIGKQISGDRTELQEARGRLYQILANLQERILLVNSEGRVMLASPGMEELLGSKAPAEGQMLEDFAGNDHPLVILVRLAMASGESSTYATLPAMKDERSKPLAATVQLTYDRGERAGALISLHDRETIAKLESQLDYSERLAAFARITSGIAHEVKNPLNAMVIHLELLRQKLERFGPNTRDALPQLDILTSEIQRLDRVVRTFLNFTRPPRMQLRPLDVNQVLEETLALSEAEAQAHSATVSRAFTPGLPRIAGDADLLKQAFLNIIINGFQAMERGGLLQVETANGGERNVRVSITDHGKGIEQSGRERIFQLYYSTKPTGNGIGLAQAYRAIQLHNGGISFTSEPGIGTTFDITIPAA